MENPEQFACVLASVLLRDQGTVTESAIAAVLKSIGITGSRWPKYFAEFFADKDVNELIESMTTIGASTAAPAEAAADAGAAEEEPESEPESEEESESDFGFGGLF
eukprot:gnl/Chilomastix_cuspidata/356.p3 GENE.gnl/Chilomastix_cuspidata/356~~gnl/Chilomastix_cuspidata/356.p3  ORF type:complete len:106 (-),score=57.78 gnl/Chilomastix_cuspidata/356:361-678(-)